jgi:FkbM family methyltransferase
MTFLKEAVKARLTEEQLASWGRLRAKMPAWLCRALSVLPTDQLVGIKEGLRPEGLLDYPSAQIRMQLTSNMERSRTHACEKEPETVAWLEQSLRRDDVLFDVGANVGAYSLLAATLCKDSSVFAFEPSFSTFAALSRNIQLNNLGGRVLPFQIALTDQTGFVEFQYRDVAPGAADHSLAADMDGRFVPAHHQQTLGYRLDDFVRTFGIPSPNLIKIDVDGGEERVLQGADATLRSPGLRSVLIEIDERVCRADRLLEIIQGCGLSLRSRHPRGTSAVANYIFARA